MNTFKQDVWSKDTLGDSLCHTGVSLSFSFSLLLSFILFSLGGGRLRGNSGSKMHNVKSTKNRLKVKLEKIIQNGTKIKEILLGAP